MPFIHSHTLRTSLLALFVSTGVTPMAAADGDISFKKAAAIAKQYVRLSSTAQRTLKSRTQPNKTGAPYYLFNDAGNKGFVLVAGNEAMGTVLARSTTASLDTLHAPEGLQFLLEAYRERFQTVQKLSAADRKRYFAANTNAGLYTPVTPLLKSEWGQGYPFNNKLSDYPAGCVATAVAQIMYFHRWPEKGVGSNAYTNRFDGRHLSADFSASRYAWHLMFDSYKRRGLTDAQRDAIGQLHHDVGIAVNMSYTSGASGSTGVAARKALKENFSYNVGSASKSDEGARGFINMLYQEVKNGYPVYIEGFPAGSPGSGHAMVVDGINSEGLLHINFGWDGQANAYYNLQSLAVGQSGSEFGGRPLSFNRQLEAVLAHPKRAGEQPIPATWSEGNNRLSFTGEGTLRLVDQTKKVFPLAQGLDVLMNYFKNLHGNFFGDVGMAIVDQNDRQVALFKYSDFGSKQIFTDRHGTLGDGGTCVNPLKMHLDTRTLTPGNYSIVPMSVTQHNGQLGEWVKMSQSPRMTFTVEQNQIKVTEENYLNAGYRVTGELENNQFEAGKSTVLRVPLHSLSGSTPPCYLKLEILDKYNVVLQTVKSSEINMDAFGDQEIPIPLTTDDNIRAGKYNVRLTVVFLDETRTPVPLRTHKDEEFFEINVTEPAPDLLLGLSNFGIYDGNGELIYNPYVNLTRSTFSIKGNLYAKGRDFTGTINFYWKDVQSGDLNDVGKSISRTIKQGQSANFDLGFMKARDFNVVNGRTYQLVAAFTDAGRKIFIPITDGGSNTYTFSGSTYVQQQKDNTYQPQTGDFVRIRLKSGKYLTAPSATESTDTRLYPTDGKIDGKTLSSPETIFRLTGNGLLSLSGGRAVRHASSSSDQLTEGLQVAPNDDQPDALTIKGAQGKHVIQWRSGGSLRTSEEVVIEKVNELPVLIGQFGYSTFYTPVDAVLNGAKVYGGTPQNDHLQLHELPNNIPAGTAFIISGRPNSWVTLSLQEKRSFPAIVAEKNALFGFDTPHAVPTDETFAFSRSTGTFMRLNVWQRPFRAYLSNRDHLISASPDGLKMGLITSTLQTKKSDATTLLFNIKGIRIDKPIPGQIYVRNGKKFIAR